MFCPACGTNNDNAATQCFKCGARLLTSAGLPPPMPQSVVPYANPRYYRQRDIGQDPGIRLLLPVGRSGWAIAAGYAGLLSVVLIPAPLAVLLSIIAIVDIKKHPDRHGMGRAIFGLIMGGAFSIILLVMIVMSATGQRIL